MRTNIISVRMAYHVQCARVSACVNRSDNFVSESNVFPSTLMKTRRRCSVAEDRSESLNLLYV